MRFSWNWISDWVDLSGIAPEDVASRLTMTVAELDGTERVGQGLRDILVGRLAAVEPHPNADRLRVIEVDLGGGRTVRGVSGAPNLAAGLTVPVALPGVTLPGGVEIRAADVRGVASEVVVLSEREMGLSDDHSGVLELPPDTRLGVPFPDVLPVEDFVFEVDNKSITHRPDLWGHHGLAREIAAMVRRPLAPLPDSFPQGDADPLMVSVDDGRDCPRYMAMCFTGVRILPSPFKIRHRLRTVGLRPISNVVDLTNYIMVAIGEPTHAFDRRQIGGDTIRVRRARPGERMRTLDGTDHELTGEDLLIADANRGVALAGVMGGENSEILPDTAEMVLEAATFHPGRIRRTAVRHGIRTDSSARFEKSLDPAFCPRAVSMFASMLASVSPGARPSSRAYDVAVERKPLHVALHPAYVSRRLGIEVPPERTAGILSSLGFAIAGQPDGAFDVTVPSWRATRDVSIPEDLVEEVGRVIGYDKVPPAGPLVAVTLVARHPPRALAGRVKRVLSLSCGLDEVRTYSFDSEPLLRKIGLAAGPVRLKNPISADMTTLRTELATGLLGAMERNSTRYADFGIYEVGRVFLGEHDPDGVPVQPQRAAVLLYDRAAKGAEGAEALMRRLRGVLDHLLDRLDRGRADLSEEGVGPHAGLPWVVAGGSAAVNVAGAAVGYVTRVHPAVMKALDCAGVAVVAEIDLGALLAAPEAARTWAAVPRFPSIQADLSFVADQRLKAGDLDRIVRANAGDLLAGVELVAVYSGAPIPEGSRSLSFRMTFLAPDRTLSDAEVKAAVDRVVAAARDAGATIRL